MAALAFVIALHVSIAPQVAASKVLYLAGDTTRDAWRAVDFIRSGHFSHEFGAAYESEYFALVFVPFLLIFGNTILCLQMAALFMALAAVVVLYMYVRRIYGLLAALCLGSLFATAPPLLAHLAVFVETSLPLLIGIVMILATSKDPRVKCGSMALAGLFTGFNVYFLFPFAVYLLSFPDELSIFRSPGAARERRCASLCYLAGAATILWKFARAVPFYGYFKFESWFQDFFWSNLNRWRHPGAILSDLWTQWTWCAGSLSTYSRVRDPACMSWLVFFWVIAALGCLTARGRSRRMLVAYGAGLLAIALMQSTRGLGVRHLLALLPFQWLFMAPVIARPGRNLGRVLLIMVVGLITVAQYRLADGAAAMGEISGSKETEDTEYIARLVENQKDIHVNVVADDSNAFFSLKYLAPTAAISYSERSGPEERHGFIYYSRDRTDPVGEPALRKKLLLSGNTAYDLAWLSSSGRRRQLSKSR